MADRDVIHKALQDWCWSDEAPLHLAALDPRDLGRLAEVAAKAMEETGSEWDRVTEETTRFHSWFAAEMAPKFEGADAFIKSVAENAAYLAWLAALGLDFERALEDMVQRKKADIERRERELGIPPPVGTPAEAQACAARSGVGEDF